MTPYISIDLLDTFLTEFDVHTIDTAIDELEETSEYHDNDNDRHGEAAQTVLDNLDKITAHWVKREFTSSRIDRGEDGCALLTKRREAEFLTTDDLQALHELQDVVGVSYNEEKTRTT